MIHLSFRSWSSYHILGLRGFIFLLGVPSSPNYLVAKLHLNHCKATPCIFNFSFFLSSFYYWSSSWRLYMVVRQGFLSFFNCSLRFLSKLRSAKLYSKINMVLNTCFVFRSSSFLHLAFQSAIPSILSLRWGYAILDNFTSCFMIRKLLRMRYLNPCFSLRSGYPLQPINLFIGDILAYISPKAFPKE